jgi:hypothetical protein
MINSKSNNLGIPVYSFLAQESRTTKYVHS